MHRFRAKAIALAISRSAGSLTSPESILKDDELIGKKHVAINYTLAKTGFHKKLHRI